MANNKDCGFRTSIGGQALIEGILMRGPKKQAIVCRTAEGLVEKVDELKLLKDKYPDIRLAVHPRLRDLYRLHDKGYAGAYLLSGACAR